MILYNEFKYQDIWFKNYDGVNIHENIDIKKPNLTYFNFLVISFL